MNKQVIKDLLEQIIDSASLAELLEAASEVCHEKADHLETNWQSYVEADRWSNAAEAISRIASSEAVPVS
ncbi:hypothetical protein [Hymenobacter glacieicola]|uniref:Uncharacterized protein n=1 Tax=Hymenobacter glacieicola TaxID=1562124 RepID=A0ABQ1X5K9_9BACT|nr:hypothetical protein [Hymenobacter glacieicola]GGG61054.1 hypothetical protein GCM10011378_41330 [Hymenobacter glacieicola]